MKRTCCEVRRSEVEARVRSARNTAQTRQFDNSLGKYNQSCWKCYTACRRMFTAKLTSDSFIYGLNVELLSHLGMLCTHIHQYTPSPVQIKPEETLCTHSIVDMSNLIEFPRRFCALFLAPWLISICCLSSQHVGRVARSKT